MSAHCVAQELSRSQETVRATLKKVGYFSYRISVLYKQKPEDYTPCYNYCDWFFKKFGCDIETLTTILFSDEAWLYLSRFVNLQNYRIWFDK